MNTAETSPIRFRSGLLHRLLRVKELITLVSSYDHWLTRLLTFFVFLWLFIAVILPLYQILIRSMTDESEHFVGVANFIRFFSSPNLSESLYNTLWVSVITTAVAVLLGFFYAYALTRTPLRGKTLFRSFAMVPLYAPTLMNGIALIYLFGNKGLFTTGFFGVFRNILGIRLGIDIHLYGPVGIIIAEVIYTFPQAVLILSVALLLTDARLYEAAQSLGASRLKTFFTVTLPSIKYGLMSAFFVCFTFCFTDFGAPKVVGGNYNVLATDIYKHVIGQQNFVMGATVSIVLLLPALVAFILDRIIQRRQAALITSKVVPLTPKPNSTTDRLLFLYCVFMSGAILIMTFTVVLASLVKVWPYNLSLGFGHYNFNLAGGGGYSAYWNSVRMSFYTAAVGTAVTFISAYLIEKVKGMVLTRQMAYFISIIPLALPGLVIGLAYIFFFNHPTLPLPFIPIGFPNPFHFLYGTMAILVLSNIVHFYSVSFLTATTALKQLDREFENISASMGVPSHKTFLRVTVPVCLPAIMEIGMYYFVNAMATVSAVIFLYGPDIKLASVAVVNMDDAGDTAQAAAMSALIVFTNIAVRLLHHLTSRGLINRSQSWRKK